MKQRGRNMDWILRRAMALLGTILLLMLALRGIEQAGFGIHGEKMGRLLKENGQAFIGYVWRKQYISGESGEGGTASKSGFLDRLFAGWLPWLSLTEVGQDGTGAWVQDEDPAYASFLENEKFYAEHQYLVRYGGEETGTVLAEGQAGQDGAGGPSALDQPGQAGAGENAGSQQGESSPATVAQTAGSGAEPATSHYAAGQLTCDISSVLPVLGTTYRLEQLADYDYLMKHFYSVHTTATAGRDFMKAGTFLKKDFALEGGSDKPQILIYHSHSQEEYADYSQGNKEATVVGMGSYLTKLLTDKGYNVIHDTSVYDLKNGKLDRNKAYTYALDGITGILQNNPSVEVVLDLHRDGVGNNLHMVNEVNGKPTAPIMFFNGVSQTPEGPIEYLQNPYREDNLAFSFQLQLDAAAYYPGLTRKIYIKGLRYNLHLRPRSALVEVGAQTNTYEEALNAMEPLAELLDMVLREN